MTTFTDTKYAILIKFGGIFWICEHESVKFSID